MVTTWEADDFTEYGRVTDAFFGGGGAELLMELSSADSPIAGWQGSTYVDVPQRARRDPVGARGPGFVRGHVAFHWASIARSVRPLAGAPESCPSCGCVSA